MQGSSNQKLNVHYKNLYFLNYITKIEDLACDIESSLKECISKFIFYLIALDRYDGYCSIVNFYSEY